MRSECPRSLTKAREPDALPRDRLLVVHGDSQLREEKAVYIGSLFKRFIFIGTNSVPGVGIGAEQHRKSRRGRGLQFSDHLAGVRWVYAMVVVAGDEQYRRIFRAGLHVVVGRVGIESL